jgi:hypothetical protein
MNASTASSFFFKLNLFISASLQILIAIRESDEWQSRASFSLAAARIAI